MNTDFDKYKIFEKEPKSWNELQIMTSSLLSDMGYLCEIEKNIETARGKVNIDVYAQMQNKQPSQTILVECKYWSKRVPKTVIHAFRSVVNDSGANFGIIISKKGFQEGAVSATQMTNISLYSWEEFQDYFKAEWLKSMIHSNHVAGRPLLDFTDYMGDFYYAEFDELSDENKEAFFAIKRKYSEFAIYCHKDYYLNQRNGDIEYLDRAIDERKNKMPIEINSYSDYFYFVKNYCKRGLVEFDMLFGKEVRK